MNHDTLKAIRLLAILAFAALLMALSIGCVPASRITLGSTSIYSPKNVSIVNFEAVIQSNGALRVRFDSLSSSNSPAVIDATTAKQAAITGAAVEAAVKGALGGVKP